MTPNPQRRTPLVYVNIVARNAERWVEPCLASIERTDYGNFETLFVDNASDDATLRLIRSRFPKVQLIRNAENHGFGRAHNVGIVRALSAGADYILLLNVDTTVDPLWLHHLVEAAKSNPDAGLLMPM